LGLIFSPNPGNRRNFLDLFRPTLGLPTLLRPGPDAAPDGQKNGPGLGTSRANKKQRGPPAGATADSTYG